LPDVKVKLENWEEGGYTVSDAQGTFSKGIQIIRDSLGQVCQIGCPIACSMWPAVTFYDLTI
jgi:hypothetical protein